MMCEAEAVGLMITWLKNQLMPEAFHINYSFCPDTNTSPRHRIQLNLSSRAGGVLSLQSTCQIFTGLFIQMCIIPKTCVFNFVSVRNAELHPHF